MEFFDGIFGIGEITEGFPSIFMMAIAKPVDFILFGTFVEVHDVVDSVFFNSFNECGDGGRGSMLLHREGRFNIRS